MFLKVSLAEWPMVVWLFGLTVCVWKLPKASLIIVRHTGLCTHCTLIVHSLSGSACFSTLLSFLHKHCFLREKTRRLKGRPEIQTRQFSPRKVGNEFKAFIGISLFLYEKYELLWKQNNETVFFYDISSKLEQKLRWSHLWCRRLTHNGNTYLRWGWLGSRGEGTGTHFSLLVPFPSGSHSCPFIDGPMYHKYYKVFPVFRVSDVGNANPPYLLFLPPLLFYQKFYLWSHL